MLYFTEQRHKACNINRLNKVMVEARSQSRIFVLRLPIPSYCYQHSVNQSWHRT